MRIDCPGCAAAYQVPDEQVRPGRKVRCTRCGLQWEPAAELGEPAAVAAVRAATPLLRQAASRPRNIPQAAPRPPQMPPEPSINPPAFSGASGKAVGPKARPQIAPWGIGWAASVVILVGILAAAGHWRSAIMHGWPPAIRLYTAVGADPPRS